MIARLMTAAVLVLFARWSATNAQTPGTVRAQGRDVGSGTEGAPNSGPAKPYFDVREEIRQFVQNISAFAKRYNPNFVVITQNGLELVSKQREGDEDRVAPARAYMLSVDAILQEALYYGAPEPGAATKNERRKDAAQLRRILQPVALSLGAKGRDDVFGWGLVNLEPKCPG